MIKLWMAPHGLHIEPGKMADAKELARIHAAGFYRGWPAGEFENFLTDANTPVYVACDARRRIAGFALVRVVAAGGSYLAASDRHILVGLGAADRVERLTIRWPSGAVQTWNDLPADRSLAVVEGGEPSPAVEAPPAGARLNASTAESGGERSPTPP